MGVNICYILEYKCSTSSQWHICLFISEFYELYHSLLLLISRRFPRITECRLILPYTWFSFFFPSLPSWPLDVLQTRLNVLLWWAPSMIFNDRKERNNMKARILQDYTKLVLLIEFEEDKLTDLLFRTPTVLVVVVWVTTLLWGEIFALVFLNSGSEASK